MPERGEHDWGEDRGSRRGRDGLIVIAFASAARALEAETDRWFLWIPVLFAGGIVTYFTLQAEPDPRIALALVVGALGLALTLRTAPLGLAIGGASLPSRSASPMAGSSDRAGTGTGFPRASAPLRFHARRPGL